MQPSLIDLLEPLANIALAFEKSELDEHRPEWGYRRPEDVVLVEGRGGNTLLTLKDAMDANAWRKRLIADKGGLA